MRQGVTLDPFYLVVDGADWIERLVPLGLRLVQLRVKDRSDSDLRAEIRRARETCATHDCQLVVNDYWRLAIEEGCDFVHLGQEDLAEADLPAIRRADVRLGISTHDPAELETALAESPDYVALGPIYPTVLKQMKWAPQGLGRLAEWKRRVAPLRLVAIGGLTPERLPAVFEAGADSAAVVTDVLRHADPGARTTQWLTATADQRRKGPADGHRMLD